MIAQAEKAGKKVVSITTPEGATFTFEKWWPTDGLVDQSGNRRRGVGTQIHCMHGKDAIIEELLDWRPFDYFTLSALLPMPGDARRTADVTGLRASFLGFEAGGRRPSGYLRTLHSKRKGPFAVA